MKQVILFLLFISFFCGNGCSRQEIKDSVVTGNKKISDVYKSETLSFLTSDNLNIKGAYYYSEGKTDISHALVVLIHQFRSDRSQWQKSFIDSLISKNYYVLAYDIRSHGESDKASVEKLELLKSPDQVTKDIEAVIKWAKSKKNIDSSRIAVIGTSIGASIGIYARIFLGAKTVIGISGGKGTFEAFTGYDERSMTMSRIIPRFNSVLFICGEKDNDYAKEEKSILDNYAMEPMKLQLYASEKHGKELISQFPEINELMLKWLSVNL